MLIDDSPLLTTEIWNQQTLTIWCSQTVVSHWDGQRSRKIQSALILLPDFPTSCSVVCQLSLSLSLWFISDIETLHRLFCCPVGNRCHQTFSLFCFSSPSLVSSSSFSSPFLLQGSYLHLFENDNVDLLCRASVSLIPQSFCPQSVAKIFLMGGRALNTSKMTLKLHQKNCFAPLSLCLTRFLLSLVL